MRLREAKREDLPTIVRMLADDPLGQKRHRVEDPLPKDYYAAFDAIAASPSNALYVAEVDGEIVGTLQLTFIPGLDYLGAERMMIEAVRVATEDLRVIGSRYRAGIATMLDLLTSQQSLVQAELDLVSARFTYQVTRATLAALLGRDL